MWCICFEAIVRILLSLFTILFELHLLPTLLHMDLSICRLNYQIPTGTVWGTCGQQQKGFFLGTVFPNILPSVTTKIPITPYLWLFVAIDKLTPHWRGCHVRREILWMETRWIYCLKTYITFGLNVEWDENCFINNR